MNIIEQNELFLVVENEITLLDIIPMNIGISSSDNKMSIMIKKNSKKILNSFKNK